MTSREKVQYMIKNYPKTIEKMQALDQEIQAFQKLTEDEAISMLTFPGKTEDHVYVQHMVNTDKVLNVASSYKRICWQINYAQQKEWIEEYGHLARQVEFLHHAIRRLPQKQREVMSEMLIRGRTWAETCEKLKMSGASITKLRVRAVGNMALTLETYYDAFGFSDSDFEVLYEGC